MDVMCPDCIIQATEGLEMSATTPHPLAHSVRDAVGEEKREKVSTIGT